MSTFRLKNQKNLQRLKKSVGQSNQEEEVQKQSQQMEEIVEQKQQNSVDEPRKYKIGQFSKFAIKQQNKENQQEFDISQIIREAIASHLTAVRQFVSTQNQLKTKSQDAVKQFHKLFYNQDANWSSILQINKFMQNPIQYTIEQKVKNSDFDIIKIVEQFTRRIIKCHQIAIIEGKIMKFNDIKTQEYVQNENKIYYPTSYDNIFVSIGQSKIPILNYFDGVDMLTKQQLLKMKPLDREKIINMVIMFCKSKRFIIPNETIDKKITEVVNEQISQMTP